MSEQAEALQRLSELRAKVHDEFSGRNHELDWILPSFDIVEEALRSTSLPPPADQEARIFETMFEGVKTVQQKRNGEVYVTLTVSQEIWDAFASRSTLPKKG